MFTPLKRLSPLLLSGMLAALAVTAPRSAFSQSFDWRMFSISDLAPVSTGGAFGGASWRAGTPASELLRVGSFDETELPSMSMGEILRTIGIDPKKVSLASVPFVTKMSLKDLVKTIPSLGSLKIGNVAPLNALIRQELGASAARRFSQQTLSQAVRNPLLGSLRLNELSSLTKYSITAIPSLSSLPLNKIKDWQLLAISDIPGLDRLPFSTFLDDLPGLNIPLAVVDVVFSEAEANRLPTVSGSYKEGFAAPCEQDNCASIELDDLDGLPAGYRGKYWISGDSQWVSGGSGCLSGIEPVGRHPLGKGMKLVATNINEAKGTVDFSLYFRFSIFCGKSPYIIGPFPAYTTREKDTIIIGF